MRIYHIRHFFHRLFHWEYWPQWLVYFPVFPVYLYYSFRARTPFFVVATNPGIENGGYLLESKYNIHLRLPRCHSPQTIKVLPGTDASELMVLLKRNGLEFPLFCKPDIGGKGLAVVKVGTEKELLRYHAKAPLAYLLQQEIPFINEVGIFYCQNPGHRKGKITGIVSKAFPVITGDGIRTVRELINDNPRYYFQRNTFSEKHELIIEEVPEAGEQIRLSEIGNHARGSLFTDISDRNNLSLESVISEIAHSYQSFYFGRFDIKYDNWDDLCSGKNFMIVELNGGGSEPTHLYDPSKKIWQAWGIILFHWKWMYQIAGINHRNGNRYVGIRQGVALVLKARKVARSWRKSGLV